MDIKPVLEKLEKSDDFLKWKSKNKDTYFSYAFKIPQEMQEDWHIGYYNKDRDKITTFVVTGNGIDIKPEDEIFKEERQVNGINLSNLKLSFEEIMDKAREFQAKTYPKEKSVKTIAILQSHPSLGDVWNITYITEAFNTLNMKIDASSGNVLDHKIASIFDFKTKD